MHDAMVYHKLQIIAQAERIIEKLSLVNWFIYYLVFLMLKQ
jgi:hypothetical protein